MLTSPDAVAEVFMKNNISSVLLVTDSSIRKFGITSRLEETLNQNKIKCTVYDGTVANPTTDNVREATKLYKDNACQALIGFGGGSSIDCAKAVGACISNPGKTFDDMKGTLKIFKKIPLLVAVPTTAGTGSETTVTAVITDSKTRRKYPMNAFPLIPRYAMLDPEVTRTLPRSLTSTTGIDALTHAVEAYIGGSTTAQTRRDSVEAVKLIFENVKKAYDDGNDMTARANMLKGSFLAGCAFTVSYVGYVHAVAHSLGGFYNTPHGLANSVLLPYVLESYGESAELKIHKLAVAVGISKSGDDVSTSAKMFIEAIRDLNASMGIGTKLSDVKACDIPKLAGFADSEGNPQYPVPKLMDAHELEQFYYDVLEG